MNTKIKKTELIHKNGELKICFEKENLSNQTTSEIVIYGNRYGFLNFSHMLIYHLNMLDDIIVISDFPFITSNLKLEIHINNNLLLFREGEVKIIEEKFIWFITENNLAILTTAIQSLAYINEELHIDHDMPKEAISIYLVVED